MATSMTILSQLLWRCLLSYFCLWASVTYQPTVGVQDLRDPASPGRCMCGMTRIASIGHWSHHLAHHVLLPRAPLHKDAERGLGRSRRDKRPKDDPRPMHSQRSDLVSVRQPSATMTLPA